MLFLTENLNLFRKNRETFTSRLKLDSRIIGVNNARTRAKSEPPRKALE